MLETITIAAWLVALYYGIKAGGPVKIYRILRDPNTPRRYKIGLALCALPWPWVIDELLAAYLMNRLANINPQGDN